MVSADMMLKVGWVVCAILGCLTVIVEWVVASEIDKLTSSSENSNAVFARVWVSFIILFHTIGATFVLFSGHPSVSSEMSQGGNIGMNIMIVLFMMAEAGNVGSYTGQFSDVDSAETATIFISLYLILLASYTFLLISNRSTLALPKPSAAPGPAASGEAMPPSSTGDV